MILLMTPIGPHWASSEQRFKARGWGSLERSTILRKMPTNLPQGVEDNIWRSFFLCFPRFHMFL